MPLLRCPKTFEHTHKIKIEKSLKRVDSDCCFFVLETLPIGLQGAIDADHTENHTCLA